MDSTIFFNKLYKCSLSQQGSSFSYNSVYIDKEPVTAIHYDVFEQRILLMHLDNLPPLSVASMLEELSKCLSGFSDWTKEIADIVNHPEEYLSSDIDIYAKHLSSMEQQSWRIYRANNFIPVTTDWFRVTHPNGYNFNEIKDIRVNSDGTVSILTI